MKGKLNLIVGLIALATVIYYIVKCPSFDCSESIFGFHVSGIVFLLFWGFLAIMILRDVYKKNTNKT